MPEPAQHLKVQSAAQAEMEKYYPAAYEGDPDAQNKIGNALLALREFEQALEWYHLAAAQGWPNSCCNIGDRYALGEGVEQSPTEAIKWWKKAAAQGFAPACLELGVFYFEGTSVAKDDQEAVKWLDKGAKLGDAQCAFNAGIMYGEGLEAKSLLPADNARAADYLREAIRLGLEGPQASQCLAFVESGLRLEELEAEQADLMDDHNHAVNESVAQQNDLNELNSKLASMGGVRCPSCDLRSGVKMDAGMRGEAFGESLATMGSPFSALSKTYKCMACDYIW